MKTYSPDFMKKLIAHLKAIGFVFQGSEIYGGLANTWDYGPYGSLMKDNVASAWKDFFISQNDNAFLIDSKILMNPLVWKTSGHLSNFSDYLIEDKISKKRYRADHLVEEHLPHINVAKLNETDLEKIIKDNIKTIENKKVEWSEIRKFNLMFETYQGVIENNKDKIYLRPETAQGIFINFKNVQRSTRTHLPLAIGQIGKSFRNEVTPGNFVFRTREFEQMELEVFTSPETSMQIFDEYIKKSYDFLISLGLDEKNLKIRKHSDEELAHYSKATSDIEFNFPWGWGELMGVAHRGDFDLSKHQEASKENFEYLDPHSNKKFIPHVIEPSIGLDRLLLALWCQAFSEEIISETDTRINFQLPFGQSPIQLAVLPLVKKQSELALKIKKDLQKQKIKVVFDETGSIGKRYRRYDALGVKYCLTVDYDSENDLSYTLRERDSMQQERLTLEEIIKKISI